MNGLGHRISSNNPSGSNSVSTACQCSFFTTSWTKPRGLAVIAMRRRLRNRSIDNGCARPRE
jgi:hypothetical protein